VMLEAEVIGQRTVLSDISLRLELELHKASDLMLLGCEHKE
jgi:hypothetical protein